jgi:hypothetical protein
MNVFDFSSVEFLPTDLQPAEKRDAYLESSPEDVIMAETQRQIRLRSRHIGASALRLAREQNKDLPSVTETDIVKFIEMVAGSLTQGVQVPSSFPRSSRQWLVSVLSGQLSRINGWEQIIRFSQMAADSELEYGDSLLYQNRSTEILLSIRFIRAAVLLENDLETVSQKATRNFLLFCENTDEAFIASETTRLSATIHQFLRNFVQLLKFGSHQEIQLNLCRFWAEQFASRYTCTLQEWQFLISSIEQSILTKIGVESSRSLAPFFVMLTHAVVRFEFCGNLHRQKSSIFEKLPTEEYRCPIEPKVLFDILVGEIYLLENPGFGLTTLPLSWQVIRENSPLFGTSPAGFSSFFNKLLQACRPLAERSSLDWLEAVILRTQNSLICLEDMKKADPLFEAVLQSSVGNLRQGLDVFKNHLQLHAELKLILHYAQKCVVATLGKNDAKALFRTWFTKVFISVSQEGAWAHGKVIISALKTAIRQKVDFEVYWQKYGVTLELIDSVPEILDDMRFVLRALPHIGEHGLRWRKRFNSVLQQQQTFDLLRQSLNDYLVCGESRSWQATLGWAYNEISPFSQSDYENDYRWLMETLQDSEVFSSSRYLVGFARTLSNFEATLLGIRLWNLSDIIAQDTALAVYDQMPEYRAITGESGVGKCARDNAITLRRVALAFSPEVTDRLEFLDSWWNNLVNNYIVNRPRRLFLVNRECLVNACLKNLGSGASFLIEQLVKPVFESVSAGGIPESTGRVRFESLNYGFTPLFGLENRFRPEILSCFEDFLNTGLFEAFRFATGRAKALHAMTFETEIFPAMGVDDAASSFLENSLPYIGTTLSRGLIDFEVSGVLSKGSRQFWHQLLHLYPEKSPQVELLLNGYRTQLVQIRDELTRVRFMDYIQANCEFVRQNLAGLQLQKYREVISAEILGRLSDEDSAVLANYLPNLLERLADVLTTHDKTSAILEIHRFLVLEFSSQIGDRFTKWSMLGAGLAEVSKQKLDPLLCDTLDYWWNAFQRIESTMPILGLIHAKFIGSSDPIFSPDPMDEAEWRTSLSSLLSLVQVRLAHLPSSARCRLYLLSVLPLARHPDFEQRLESILNLIRSWFFDLDLTMLTTTWNETRGTSQQIRILENFRDKAGSMGSRFVERIPALKSMEAHVPELLQRLAAGSTDGALIPFISSRLPAVFRGLPLEVLPTLMDLPESDKERFRLALINVYALVGGNDQIGQQWMELIKFWSEPKPVAAK